MFNIIINWLIIIIISMFFNYQVPYMDTLLLFQVLKIKIIIIIVINIVCLVLPKVLKCQDSLEAPKC